MSDPHIRIFNDTIYLFCGHDQDPDDTTWVMNDWRIFSSSNLTDWKFETTISPADNYMGGESKDCWAGDAAKRNGNYYFYFSDRKRGIGVMRSEFPAGPYVDALGKELIAPMHDPTVLIDDDRDQTPYIVYGDKEGSYHAVRLNDDMITLYESPKPLTINGKQWEDAPSWMDKNYIFKHRETYYLSWGRDYAISDNIYGPYECVGTVGTGHQLSEFAHGSFFWWEGQFYHIWCYYIRPGYKYRESIITYCHFDDMGRIVTDTDFLDKHFTTGMGQYEASWAKIEGEWYYEKSASIIKTGSREEGFELGGIVDGSWIRFANMNFGNGTGMFSASVQNSGKDARIQVKLDSITGPIIGEAFISGEKETGEHTMVSCKLQSVKGTRDVYLRFTGKGTELFTLDWIRFE